MMRIGILAPTRIKEFCIAGGFQEPDYRHFLEKVSEFLAASGHEIVIMPSHLSVQGIVAQTYKDLGGKKIVGIIPQDDTEFGLRDIDESMADENINCGTWRNQPEKLCEESDVLLCVGLSPGAMIEICYSKWFRVKKVLMLKEFLSARLHPEIEKDLDVEYVLLEELNERLR